VSYSPGTGCVLGRPHVLGIGPVPAQVMVIGQAPNDASIQAKRPWVGTSGNTLGQWLRRLDLNEAEVYLTNAVKCPAHHKYPGQADQISYNQKKACYQWLKDEIEVVRPKVVVLLGSSATQMFFKDDSMTVSKFRAQFGWSHKVEGTVYFPLRHPSYEARNPDMFKSIVEEWAKLDDLLKLCRA